MEQAESFKFLGLHVSQHLSWKDNTDAIVKKAQQRLYFIRMLKKAGLGPQPLTLAYRGLVESILTSGITVWFGNTTQSERKSLQRVVKSAERITGVSLPAMDAIYTERCRRRAQSILKDPHHPAHSLFVWRESGHNLRHQRPESISAHTTRFSQSFFPATVRLVAKDIRDGNPYGR